MPWCSRGGWAVSSGRVRADEPRRFMSSDEGGVRSVSPSSSVRRARSRRGTLPAGSPALFVRRGVFEAGRLTAFFFAAGFGAAFLLVFLTGARFLADACRFAEPLAVGRLAEPRRAADFEAGLRDFARPAALRLAMLESFRNLDSLTISVVLSVAYRNSEKLSGGRHPLNQPPAISGRPLDRKEEDAQGMANVDENTPGAGGVAPSERPERGERTYKGTLQARRREDDDQIDPPEYARLLDSYDNSFRNIAEGEVVKGTVLKVTASEVIVDVGYKSEGIISVDEFLDENREVTVQAGDIVDVLLERTEDREGYVVLSREKAEKMKIWDEVEKAYAERKVVIGRVIERIKGGLAVDIGVRAFLPGSQIDVRPVRNL